MSDNKLLLLHKLRTKVEELEGDPEIQNSLHKAQQVEQLAERNSLSTYAVFSLLMPHFNGARTSIKLPEYRRLPSKRETKLALHRDLSLLIQKARHVLDRLENDPDVIKRIQILNEIKNLDLTPDEAAQLLDPDRYAKGVQSMMAERQIRNGKAGNISKSRKKRYWKNPHNGQIVSGYASNLQQLHRWKEEHGEEVDNWEISEDEALEEKKD